MKNIIIHKNLEDYKRFIRDNIVINREFYENDFYRGLIDFIIDNRTPIFFYPSKDYEYAHFTQYFNWVLIRDNYDNSYIKDLYFLHDFVHMVFFNPLNPRVFSVEEFRNISVSNERVAANETEIFVYYRLPELRNRTFKFHILYDYLRARYKNIPEVEEVEILRTKLIEGKKVPYFLNNRDGKRIVAFLRRFKDNNKLWAKLWWSNFPQNRSKYLKNQISLPPLDYERFLRNYRPSLTQEGYEKNIIRNITLGLEMLGKKNFPGDNEDVNKYLSLFENKIFMENTAKKYHQEYVRARDEAQKV